MMQSYKDLIVWQKAMNLAIEIYKLTSSFPKDETYGLVSQMRRASVSIPSNIAEGKLRYGNKEFKYFLQISIASGGELETQIEIAKRLPQTSNLDYNKVDELLSEVMKMLVSFVVTLAKSKK